MNLWVTGYALEGHSTRTRTVHLVLVFPLPSLQECPLGKPQHFWAPGNLFSNGYWKQANWPRIFVFTLIPLKLTWQQVGKTLCGLEVASNLSSLLYFPTSFRGRIQGEKCVSSFLQLNFTAEPVGFQFQIIDNATLPMEKECSVLGSGIHSPLASSVLCLFVRSLAGTGEQSIQG